MYNDSTISGTFVNNDRQQSLKRIFKCDNLLNFSV